MVMEEEFKRVFQEHEDQLVVKRTNNVLFITPKDGGACPHWREEGCGTYLDRPIDCRLHPYMVTHIIERKDHVKFTFHNLSDCPMRDKLIPEEEAGALIVDFGNMLYGGEKSIVAQCEKAAISRLRHRFEDSISRPRYIIGGK